MLKPYQLITTLAVSAAMFAASKARAQLIYSEDFSNPDVATNWVVNSSTTGSNYVNFQFDYTTVGLPPAPHSQGGNTKGLKMSPDIVSGSLTAGAVPGVSVTPTNFSVSDNFDMHADMWVNYNGTGPATLTTGGGGSGSTIIYGCGYGTAGTGPQVAGAIDSILCGVMTDNGASAHVRMYGPQQAGSYQDGTFQTTGTTTRSFPGEPFVYNNPTGSRAFYTQSTWATSPTPNWTNFFPSVKPPQAQIDLYPKQTNIQSVVGSASFAWHDVEVQKVGNVISYLIDGHPAATGVYGSAGTPAGNKLVFTAFDINSSVSTDTNFANLNFVVFANIVVSNFPLVVNVTAPTPQASEADTNTPGVFTITRVGSTSGALTVNYTLTGTATNGVQYKTLPTSVTIADGADSTNIYVYPNDDGISLPTTAVALNLLPGQGFGAAGSAVINILDNDTPTIDIAGTSQMYGRYTNTTGTANNDFAILTLTRRGKLTTGSPLTVNLAYTGSAVDGTDFISVPSVVIADGSSSNAVLISPLDNASIYTNRTLTVNVASGSGYAIGNGPGTANVISAHYVPAPVLFSDGLTNANDGTNWSLVYGSGDTMLNTNNFSADFGMDLNNAAGGIVIPPPPGGDSHALHLTANKALNPGAPGAINAYYTNQFLSGNYAVRFQMNIIQGQQNQTEGAVFGINGTGSSSNWWYGGGYITNGGVWSSDGIWYYVTAQRAGASAGDFQEFTGTGGTNGNKGWTRLTTRAGTSFNSVFKNNPGPFTSLDASAVQTPGIPANSSPSLGYDAGTWADVEIKQQDGIVSLSINHTLIFSYTNTTVWKGGYLMLGYEDPFGDSIGSPDAGVYYANLQVVQLPTVRIDGIAVTNNNNVITFTSSDPLDLSTGFNLLTSTNITGTYTNLTGTFAPVSGSQFQVTTPYTGGAKRFFRVTHK